MVFVQYLCVDRPFKQANRHAQIHTHTHRYTYHTSARSLCPLCFIQIISRAAGISAEPIPVRLACCDSLRSSLARPENKFYFYVCFPSRDMSFEHVLFSHFSHLVEIVVAAAATAVAAIAPAVKN